MAQTVLPCPRCGEYRLYRSHTKNRVEALIKRLFPLNLYRCHACNWRGWISKRRLKRQQSLAQSFLLYLLVAFISIVVALLMKNMLQ